MCCVASPVVTSPATPAVVGAPNGAPAVHVRVERAVWGLAAMQTAWVTGTDVPLLLAATPAYFTAI